MAEPSEGGRAPVTTIPGDPKTGQPMTLATDPIEFAPSVLKWIRTERWMFSTSLSWCFRTGRSWFHINCKCPVRVCRQDCRCGRDPLDWRFAIERAADLSSTAANRASRPRTGQPLVDVRHTELGGVQEIVNLATTNWINSARGTRITSPCCHEWRRYYRLTKSAP